MYRSLKNKFKKFFLLLGIEVRFVKHSPTAYQSRFLKVLENQVDAVLYVGANRGQMVKEYLKYFPGIPIILFEPESRLAEDLKKKFKGHNSVEVLDSAVGDINEYRKFFVSSGTDGQSSSLLPMGKRHLEWSPESVQDRFEEVQVVRLDSQNLSKYKNIFLKIDVQGHELAAFKGLGNLSENVVAIDTEISLTTLYEEDSKWLEVCSLIDYMGLCVYQIDPWFHDHRNKFELLQADIRFIRPRLLES